MSISKNLEIGMGATIQYWSDRTAATLIGISHNGKRLILREDKATRTDNNGMSEMQSYAYEADPEGQIFVASLRKDGTYRLQKTKSIVSLGVRRAYHDFSF